jgi:ABC-type lipoprotein export system ATPase subunit
MSDTPPLIRLEGLSKVFYTDEVETHALSGIHLGIDKGEYVAIAGPSGCGKSTLLSILGLLDTPTSGTYVLNGNSVAGLDARQRARIRNREIGFIFQSFNLIGDLTVYENVELPLTYRGMSASSPAVNNSASPSRARWSASRRSCSRTSPPATSTPRTARPSWTCWPSCMRTAPPSAW